MPRRCAVPEPRRSSPRCSISCGESAQRSLSPPGTLDAIVLTSDTIPLVPLETYRKKRDFAKTPEPAPGKVGEGAGRFVVGRHRATRLHYDLRLEVNGVLASWAVPKGPTLDPTARRLAAKTEDHPIEYMEFEGVIPKGEYGGGDAIVWDWGTYEPEETDDPAAALAAGELKFELFGEKLRGRFTIIRTGGRRDAYGRKSDDDSWL